VPAMGRFFKGYATEKVQRKEAQFEPLVERDGRGHVENDLSIVEQCRFLSIKNTYPAYQ